jgi:predicted transcriptional regulator YdeE
MFEIKVVEFPARILIGKSADFYGAMSPKFNGQEVLGPIWGEMNAMGKALGLPDRTPMMSATRPAKSPEAENGLLTQFIGYVVEAIPADLKGLEVLEVPAGLFAYTEHLGGMDTLVDSVRGFYSALDSLKGCTQRSGFHLEIYDARFDMSEPTSIMTIAAPVQLD